VKSLLRLRGPGPSVVRRSAAVTRLAPLRLVRLGSAVVLLLAGCNAAGGGPRHLNLPGASAELPFSHVVLTGDTCYVAGTLGLDPATGRPPADVEQEVRLLLDEVRAKLALAGLSLDDVVSVQVFCPDLTLYDTFNRVYRGYFEAGYPARSFIGSGPLLRGCRFEMNAVACRR